MLNFIINTYIIDFSISFFIDMIGNNLIYNNVLIKSNTQNELFRSINDSKLEIMGEIIGSTGNYWVLHHAGLFHECKNKDYYTFDGLREKLLLDKKIYYIYNS